MATCIRISFPFCSSKTFSYFAIAIILLSCSYETTHAENDDDMRDVLIALQKLIKYCETQYKYLNLDGYFGLRVIEGHLQLLVSEYFQGRHNHLSKEILNQITVLKEASQNLSAVGLDAVKEDNTGYFNEFSSLVSKPWKVIKPHRKLEPSLRWEIPLYKAKLHTMKNNFTEKASDKCMTEVLSSDSRRCVISNGCVQLMTSRGFTGYPITHQLLWSVLVESKPKCLATVKRLGLKDVEHFQLELCTNNFYEMVAVVEVLMHGTVHGSHQDLFLEQQFVCPSLGFYEFLKKDYLKQILSWQSPSGCFGDTDREPEKENRGKINFSSLLEEYNGDKLKFVPEGKVRKGRGDRLEAKGFVETFPIQSAEEKRDKLLNNENRYLKEKLPGGSENVSKMPSLSAHHGLGDLKLTGSQRFKESHVPVPTSAESQVKYGGNNKVHIFNRRAPVVSDDLFEQHAMRMPAIKTGRRLLVEKRMKGDCLSHKTGVASGALVMYLRYLIDPGGIKWDGQHDLLIKDTRNLLEVEENLYSEEEETGEEDEGEGEEADLTMDNAKKEGNADEDRTEEGKDNDREEGKQEDWEEEEVMDDRVDQGDYPSDEHGGIDPEYDSDGNPLAPKETLLVNPKDGAAAEKGDNDYPQDKEEEEDEDEEEEEEEEKEDEEESNFYDDEVEAQRQGHIINIREPRERSKPKLPIETDNRYHSEKVIVLNTMDEAVKDGLPSQQPNYMLLMIISLAPFFILLFFFFKFVRRRRVHIRYHFS